MAKEVRVHLTAAQKSRLPAGSKPRKDAPPPDRPVASPTEPDDLNAFGGDMGGSGKARPTIANKLP